MDAFIAAYGPGYVQGQALMDGWNQLQRLGKEHEDQYFDVFSQFTQDVQAWLMMYSTGCLSYPGRWIRVFQARPDKAMLKRRFTHYQTYFWDDRSQWSPSSSGLRELIRTSVEADACVDAYTALHFDWMDVGTKRGYLDFFPLGMQDPETTLQPVFEFLLVTQMTNTRRMVDLFERLGEQGQLSRVPLRMLTNILDVVQEVVLVHLLGNSHLVRRLSVSVVHRHLSRMNPLETPAWVLLMDTVMRETPGQTEATMLDILYTVVKRTSFVFVASRIMAYYDHPEVTADAIRAEMMRRPTWAATVSSGGRVPLMPTSNDVLRLYNALPSLVGKGSFVKEHYGELDREHHLQILPELVRAAETDSGGTLRLFLAQTYGNSYLSALEDPTSSCSARSRDPCMSCTTAISTLVRLQDRCLALCGRQARCNRRHLPEEAFCQEHLDADRASRALWARVGIVRGIQQVDTKETGFRPTDMTAGMVNVPSTDAFSSETYSSTALSVNRMDFARQNGETCTPGALMIPVSRVDNLFVGSAKTEPDEYIGKFYVYEPHSTTYLTLGNVRVFGTKVHAYGALKQEYKRRFPARFAKQEVAVSRARVVNIETRRGRHMIDDIERTPLADYVALRTNLLGGYYPDAVASLLTTNPIGQRLPKTMCGWHGSDVELHLQNMEFYFLSVLKTEADTHPDVLYDAHRKKKMYTSTYVMQKDTEDLDTCDGLPVPIGTPDPTPKVHPLFPSINPENLPLDMRIDQFQFYDMPIGSLARALNIDTLILQREFIETQVQTEIFHVKQHADRFEDVCSIESSVSQTARGTRRVPTVWLPLEDGFFVRTNAGVAHRTRIDDVHLGDGVVTINGKRLKDPEPAVGQPMGTISPAHASFVHNGGLSILTLNVQHYKVISGLYQEVDDNEEHTYQAFGERILKEMPDVVCLQEDVYPRPYSLGLESAYTEVVHCLAEAFVPDPSRLANTILVRKSRALVVTGSGTLALDNGGGVDRCVAYAVVNDVKIANTHLQGGRFEDVEYASLQTVKSREVVQIIRELKPDVIVGDFNGGKPETAERTLRDHPVYRSLSVEAKEQFVTYYAGVHTTLRTLGYASAYEEEDVKTTSIFGGVPDWIYVNPKVVVVQGGPTVLSDVLRDQLSDHAGVITRIKKVRPGDGVERSEKMKTKTKTTEVVHTKDGRTYYYSVGANGKKTRIRAPS